MPIDLYYTSASAPCQAVMLVAKALDLELNLIETRLSTKAHLKPEFLKLNPQHTIPTLNDNGFALWESRAILSYLVDQYAKDDSLYPKDAQKRAIINQRLHFDIGTLYPKYVNFYRPILYGDAKPDPANVAAFQEPLELLDKFLEGEEWVAGGNLTIADISLLVTVTIMEAVGYDVSKHSNISRWLKKGKETLQGYDEIVEKGNERFREVLEAIKQMRC